MQIIEKITISAKKSSVYQAYAEIKKWKKILKDVIGVNVFYDDGINQNFEMTVFRPHSDQESIEAVRFCKPLEQIEMCQLRPPPGFKSMGGIWSFYDREDGTEVVAVRDFELLLPNEEKVALLTSLLKTNLISFKNYLETCKN